jgi:hypothetical protein
VPEARVEILGLFKKLRLTPAILGEKETKLGGAETHAETRKCADLFKRHRDELDGVLGRLIFGVLNNGLFLLDVSPFWRQAIKGFVSLAAVAIDKLSAKRA